MNWRKIDKKDIPPWIGLAFCIAMLILEIITGKEFLFYFLNVGLIFIIGYNNGRISDLNRRVSRVEDDIKEIRGDIKELLKRPPK